MKPGEWYTKKKRMRPVLTLVNNTGADVDISIFTQSPGATGAINARTKYIWDITAETYSGAMTVSIQAKTIGGVFQTYTVILKTLNALGVVNALNSLGIGLFYLDQSNNRIYLSTYNDKIIYQNLTVSGSVIIPRWIGSHNVSVAAGVNYPGGGAYFDYNNGNDELYGSVGQMPPYTINDNFDTPFPGGNLQDGDPLTIFMLGSSDLTGATNFHFVVKENGVTVLDDTQNVANPNDYTSPAFVYHLNSVYDITGTVTVPPFLVFHQTFPTAPQIQGGSVTDITTTTPIALNEHFTAPPADITSTVPTVPVGVNPGDTIQVDVAWGSGSYNIRVIIKENGIEIYNVNQAALPGLTVNFTYVAGAIYEITTIQT